MSSLKALARGYFFPFYSVLWKAEGASVIQKHPSTSRGGSRSRRLFLFYGVIILFPASDKYHSCDVKKRRKSEGSHIVSLTLEGTRPEGLILSEDAVCVPGRVCPGQRETNMLLHQTQVTGMLKGCTVRSTQTQKVFKYSWRTCLYIFTNTQTFTHPDRGHLGCPLNGPSSEANSWLE